MLHVRIAMHVDEHRPVYGTVTEFDITTILGSNCSTVHGFSIFAPGAEGGMAPVSGWVVEHGCKTALQQRSLESNKFNEGGTSVE